MSIADKAGDVRDADFWLIPVPAAQQVAGGMGCLAGYDGKLSLNTTYEAYINVSQ